MKGHIQIAIIGAGFAGLSAYLMLRKRLGKGADIKIFDMREMFTYTPGLHVTIGNYDYLEKLQFSLPEYYGEDFIHGEVVKVTKEHDIETRDGRKRTFEYAVIATGSRTDYFAKSSFIQHAYTLRHPEDICTLNKALDKSEVISVIGGGFTGVEVASMAAVRYPNKHVRLIHSRDRVLHNMSALTSKFATKRLLEHNVELVLNNKVAEICKNNLILESGETLPSDATILVSGIKRNDELHEEELTFADAYKSLESEHILVCGDASSFGLYTTAHNAMIEGRRMAHLIADKIKGISKKYPPLQNWPFLALALGPYDGLFTTPHHCIPVPFLTGFSKWFIEQRVLIEFKYKVMLPV